MIHGSLVDMIGPALAAAIIGGYHIWLRQRSSSDPAFTIQSVHAIARTAWVQSIMVKGRDILAIQTLRNSTMAATFLASTSVLLIVGVLNLSGQGEKLQGAWGAMPMFGGVDPSLWELKLLALIVNLSFAFFCFTLAIRKFHHVGYLLNVPKELQETLISPQYVATYLNGAGRSYTLGMRAYYMLLPLVFWLFGPILMVAASLVLVAALYRLDRASADELESVAQAGARQRVGIDAGPGDRVVVSTGLAGVN